MAGAPSERSRARLTGRAVVLGVVLVVLAVSYASSVRAWLEQRSELAMLQSQIAERRAAVAALEGEIVRWRDPAYVEAQARQRFGWVMPGEVGYRVIGADGQPLGGSGLTTAPAGAEAQPTRDWWEGLWGSVQAAGRQPGDRRAEKPVRTPATRIGPGSGRQPAPTRPPMGQPR